MCYLVTIGFFLVTGPSLGPWSARRSYTTFPTMQLAALRKEEEGENWLVPRMQFRTQGLQFPTSSNIMQTPLGFDVLVIKPLRTLDRFASSWLPCAATHGRSDCTALQSIIQVSSAHLLLMLVYDVMLFFVQLIQFVSQPTTALFNVLWGRATA